MEPATIGMATIGMATRAVTNRAVFVSHRAMLGVVAADDYGGDVLWDDSGGGRSGGAGGTAAGSRATATGSTAS
jgi:hypothetical protein